MHGSGDRTATTHVRNGLSVDAAAAEGITAGHTERRNRAATTRARPYSVSTPCIARCARVGRRADRTGAVVSATAPLTASWQGDRAAVRHRAIEYFGSTETCIVASRRTAVDDAWHPYPGVTLKLLDDGTQVDAPWFISSMVLQDVLEIRPDGTFTVRGRNADMVEVAGKRASLADLTRRLASIPGVLDAVVFQPDAVDSTTARRLAALVVADGLTEAAVLAKLAQTVILLPAAPTGAGPAPAAQRSRQVAAGGAARGTQALSASPLR